MEFPLDCSLINASSTCTNSNWKILQLLNICPWLHEFVLCSKECSHDDGGTTATSPGVLVFHAVVICVVVLLLHLKCIYLRQKTCLSKRCKRKEGFCCTITAFMHSYYTVYYIFKWQLVQINRLKTISFPVLFLWPSSASSVSRRSFVWDVL